MRIQRIDSEPRLAAKALSGHKPRMTNTLYYGDNLHVLREHIADGSVDLIYLDPPFNSNAKGKQL